MTSFKKYLEEKGVAVSNSGRLDRCPICEGEHTAELYKDGKLWCFRGQCKLNGLGHPIGLEEYKAMMGDSSVTIPEVPIIVQEKEEIKPADPSLINDILSDAVDFFHGELLDNNQQLEYLKNRGRTPESIEHFQVGWISNTDKLYNRLKNKYSDDDLEAVGLFDFNNNVEPKCTLGYNVFCFPIKWEGNIVNIKTKGQDMGLYINKKFVGEKYIKFLNADALNGPEVIVVEGENDAMRLWELGKKNTVATLGQLSNRQIQHLKEKKSLKKIYLCFDNDDAGKTYTMKFIKEFARSKKEVYIIQYEGKDPDVGSGFDWEGVEASVLTDELKEMVQIIKDREAEPIRKGLEAKYVKVLISGKVRYIPIKTPFKQWLDKFNFIEYESKVDESTIKDWMKRTHCYNGITVDFQHPRLNINDEFNMFYGFSCEPKATGIDIEPIYKHIKEILCSNDGVLYEYFMDWIAHMLQRPWEVVGTAPVFISKQGAGKGIIIEHLIGRIIGSDYFVSSGNGDNFTNSFNSIIEGKLLINVDEASFSGNHHEAGIFKKIIGNETIYIVRKGYEGYMANNRARLIIGSQHDSAVKIEKSNRRYFMPQVSNKYVYTEGITPEAEIQRYFISLYDIIDNGGREQFFYDMMNRNISKFNRFKAPVSEKEEDLKSQDIDEVEGWFIGSILNLVPSDCDWTRDDLVKNKSFLRSSIVYPLYKKLYPNERYVNAITLSSRINTILGTKGTKTKKIDGTVYRGWDIDLAALELKYVPSNKTGNDLPSQTEDKPAIKATEEHNKSDATILYFKESAEKAVKEAQETIREIRKMV